MRTAGSTTTTTAPMLGAYSNGDPWHEREDYGTRYCRDGVAARRGYGAAKVATRRNLRRAERREAIAAGWAEAEAEVPRLTAAEVDAIAAEVAAEVLFAAEVTAAAAEARRILTPAPEAPGVDFVTADGEAVRLTVGTRVVVGWGGGGRGKRRGFRGAGASHRSEVVAAIAADGTAVVLTGGDYDPRAAATTTAPDGSPARVLALWTTRGTPTRQIRGVVAG